MGFLDKFRRKTDQAVKKVEEQTTSDASKQQAPPGKRIKKYTSEGKPIYE
jgi:hypothetical protein